MKSIRIAPRIIAFLFGLSLIARVRAIAAEFGACVLIVPIAQELERRQPVEF